MIYIGENFHHTNPIWYYLSIMISKLSRHPTIPVSWCLYYTCILNCISSQYPDLYHPYILWYLYYPCILIYSYYLNDKTTPTLNISITWGIYSELGIIGKETLCINYSHINTILHTLYQQTNNHLSFISPIAPVTLPAEYMACTWDLLFPLAWYLATITWYLATLKE